MRRTSQTINLPPALKLGEGGLLSGPRIAVETFGELRGENAVLLLHGMSHSHRALEQPQPGVWSPHGWAHALAGPGKPLDTDVSYVISPNLLGSPFGSSSPVTPDPNGVLWGGRFPEMTVADQARALHGLLGALGVKTLKAIVGFSLGGQVALAYSALYPQEVRSVVSVMGPATLSESVRQRLALAPRILTVDPDFDRHTPEGLGSRQALARRRLEQLRDLYPRDYLQRKFDDAFAAERALEAEAKAFATAFDPNCWGSLCICMATCDITEALPGITAKVLIVSCASDELATPTKMRDTYHQLSAAGVKTRYFELQTDAGHRAPYVEPERVADALGDFVR